MSMRFLHSHTNPFRFQSILKAALLTVAIFAIVFMPHCRHYLTTLVTISHTRRSLPISRNCQLKITFQTMKLLVLFGQRSWAWPNGTKRKNWLLIRHWNIWNNTLNCSSLSQPPIVPNWHWSWRCRNSAMKTWASWRLSRKSSYCFTKVCVATANYV